MEGAGQRQAGLRKHREALNSTGPSDEPGAAPEKDKAARQKLAALTPGRQRACAGLVASAKRAGTKRKRPVRIMPMIVACIGLDDECRSWRAEVRKAMQPNVPVVAILAASLLLTEISDADDIPSDIALEEGYGYVLVYLYGQDDRSVKRLRMRNVETGETRTAIATRRSARGPAYWLEVVAVPAGKYYWSTVQLGFRNSPNYDFDEPGKSNHVFEVVPGVVTYIGDWLIDGEWLSGEPRVPTTHNMQTLRDFAEKFPRHAEYFDLWLSVEGREPFSVDDLPRFFGKGEDE